MRIFVSAGEVSGDMHGAALAAALKAARPDVELVGLGGPRMAAAGVRLIADVTPHSAVGLTEQLPHLRPVMKAVAAAEAALAAERFDAAVLIDYQGANMRLAARARAAGIPTAYYILPQEWLWGLPGGAKKVAKACDKLIAVFRREAEAYAAAGGNVAFVGHPLVDLLADVPRGRTGEGRVVALLPGSRAQEVRGLLPPFLAAAAQLRQRFPDLQFILPVPAPSLDVEVRSALAVTGLPVTLVPGGAASWAGADVVLAASGTAVLEAAILDVPCVAAYRVSWLTAFVARRLLRVQHVTLPNIVAGRAIVPELLQGDATAERLAAEATRLLLEPDALRAGYAEVRALLGGPGAIARAAAEVLALLPAAPGCATMPACER